jgi:hypothetical protein
MFRRDDFILIIENYEEATSLQIVDKKGKVYSFHHYEEILDIVDFRRLVGAVSTLGDYDRIIYRNDFKIVWDYPATPKEFGAFVEELFASQYHSPLYDSTDFKYTVFEQFGEFLEDYRSNREEPFDGMSTPISEDDLPF